MAYKHLSIDTKLIGFLSQSAMTLPLDSASVASVCAALIGADFTYLTLHSGNVAEEIKVGACVNGAVTILERGINGTQPRAFAADACVDGRYTTLAVQGTAATTAAATTPCAAPATIVWALPAGDVATGKYHACLTLPSAVLALDKYAVPTGYDIELIGNRLCIFSDNAERLIDFPLTVALKDGAGCVSHVVTGTLTVNDSCWKPPCP